MNSVPKNGSRIKVTRLEGDAPFRYLDFVDKTGEVTGYYPANRIIRVAFPENIPGAFMLSLYLSEVSSVEPPDWWDIWLEENN